MCRPLEHTTDATEKRASPQLHRTDTKASSQSYRTETRVRPRRYRLVLYERNNDRHIQDLDHVVALLIAGTTRDRSGRETRARSGARVTRDGIGRETRARYGETRARYGARVTASATADHGTQDNSWDIEVCTTIHNTMLAFSLTHPINFATHTL